MTDGLSLRAERLLAAPPMSPYVHAHAERLDDLHDPETNPDGYVPLCVAEDALVWDLLEPRLTAPRQLRPDHVAYDRMIGSDDLRAVLASFLSRRLLGRIVGPEQVAVVGGAGSVLELLFHALCDPGDGVLVPTPSYAGFWADLQTRDETVIVAVPRSPEDGYALTPAMLDAAIARADVPVKALLFTNPDNPLGRVAGPDEVGALIAWARQRGLHVVLDEVYALSVFGEAESFTSGASLVDDLGDDVHVVWSVSKDLAMSGLRAGALVTGNARLLEAVEHLAMWVAVSGDTQALLVDLLSDDAWVDGFVEENRRRLRGAYTAVRDVLDAHDLPYHPSEAGFFLLLDLRDLLDEPTWDAEERLWSELLEWENVNLTPGSACRAPEPGFFRLVFTAAATPSVVAGVTRLARSVDARRSNAGR